MKPTSSRLHECWELVSACILDRRVVAASTARSILGLGLGALWVCCFLFFTPRAPALESAATRWAATNQWPFTALARPGPPTTRHTNWARSPLDAFILAKLEERGIEPGPPADRVTLLRRATFDLIGLPPTPNELNAFVADHSP